MQRAADQRCLNLLRARVDYTYFFQLCRLAETTRETERSLSPRDCLSLKRDAYALMLIMKERCCTLRFS